MFINDLFLTDDIYIRQELFSENFNILSKNIYKHFIFADEFNTSTHCDIDRS